MSDYLDPSNKELLKDFYEEAELQVETLEQNILAVENNPANKDAVDEIFRAAHTLKGGAATVEMEEIAEFTHLLEDVLDEIRNGKISISSQLIDCLLSTVDIIKRMLRSRKSGTIFDQDISDETAYLNSFLSDGQQHAIKAPLPEVSEPKKKAVQPVTKGSALSEYEILELKNAAGDDSALMKVTVYFNEATVMNTVGGIQVYAALKEKSKILKTSPDFDLLYEDNFYPEVHYFITTRESETEIKHLCEIPEITLKVEVNHLKDDRSVVKQSKPLQKEAPKVKTTVKQEVKEIKEEIPQEFSSSTVENQGPEENKVSSVLRVDSKRIDELMNLVSQAVINKATFNQISLVFNGLLAEFQDAFNKNNTMYKDFLKLLPDYFENYKNNGSDSKKLIKEINEQLSVMQGSYTPVENDLKTAMGKFKNTIQNLGRITNELQEGVMRIRMVPVAQIFSRFPRLVRDLSRNLRKRIELVTEGEDTELDKSVIEDLLDPLIHCVRNSLDHGIESPEEREAAGKSAEGYIYLRASNKGNVIVIEIEDDGKGIDVDSVRQKAIKKGLLHPEKKLADVEAYNLIFEPGFSTAKEITNISGRGVGLDVVKKKIEKLNGSVSVWSEVGRGTKLTIKLPLTLAIIQGLLVRVGKEIYAIPITSVIDSHRIKPSEIKMIDNYEVFNLRDNVLSIIRLNRLFQIKEDSDKPYHYVVVVGAGEQKVGLIVDALIGEEDVVIKPLKDRFANSPGIAGATILGDGSVSLIIDVGQLLDLGLKMEKNKKQEREARIM